MDWPLPGGAGDILTRNRETGRDATGLFYTEVDHFWQLQHALLEQRKQKRPITSPHEQPHVRVPANPNTPVRP